MQNFYIDTCIYLNLWKKEKGVIFGKPLWLISKEFFELMINNNYKVYYSGFILKELYHKLDEEEFNKKRVFIESTNNFIKIDLTNEEYKQAKLIERKVNFAISFFDIIHLILAKKSNSMLITRDKELLKIAKRLGAVAKKPEEVIN